MLPGGRSMITVSGSLKKPLSGLCGNRRNRVPDLSRVIGYMTILPLDRMEESILIRIPEAVRKIYKRNGYYHSETLFKIPGGKPRLFQIGERPGGTRRLKQCRPMRR